VTFSSAIIGRRYKIARAIWNKKVIAESDKYELVEGNVYFPHESVDWSYFEKGDREYTCWWKGEACYYNIG